MRGLYQDNDVKSIRLARNCQRIPSTLHIVLNTVKNLNLPYPEGNCILTHPPWAIKKTSCDVSLSGFKKTNISADAFRQLFLGLKAYYEGEKWTLWYTDGSRCKGASPSFAVVDSICHILRVQILPDIASVFTAEAAAIRSAIIMALKTPSKILICTDSLSVLKAVQNPAHNSIVVNLIRDMLIENDQKVKLLWIPGYIGIMGNEAADRVAKSTSITPVTTKYSVEKADVRRVVLNHIRNVRVQDWFNYNHHYTAVNRELTTPTYPISISKQNIQTFVRLRLGHTLCTHQHLLTGNPPPTCPRCSHVLTLNHIFSECTALEGTRNRLLEHNWIELLKIPTEGNIIAINNFIKAVNVAI